MKTFARRLTALVCSAAVLLSVSMTAFAAEGQKPVYELDDKEYMARVDELYNYIPLEGIVLAALDDMVIGYSDNYLSKWFYKHVFTNAPEVKIDIRPSDSSIPAEVPFMAGSVFMAEQGRADDIEEEDGKVRKFNDITVNWNTLTSKKMMSEDTISEFLKDKGYDMTAVAAGTKGRKFYLSIKENIKKDDLLNAVEALNEKFGMLPSVFGYEKGKYTLYHESEYTGFNRESEYDTSQRYYNDYANIAVFKRDHPLLKNKGTFASGVKFEFNPETKVAVVTGEGIITYEEAKMFWETFAQYRPADVIVIGKDVTFETDKEYYTRKNDEYAQYAYDGVNAVWYLTRASFNEFLYVYRDSDADKADKRNMERYDEDSYNKAFHCINYIDDDIDPYDVLSGKVTLTPENDDKSALNEHIRELEEKAKKINEELEQSTETDTEPTADGSQSDTEAELKGDVDVNGTVDLADLTALAKYNLSSSSFPLINETAYKNADMNGDGKIDGIDTSALIENQLGKK